MNGERAQTLNACGWPNEVGIYRVDVQLPEKLKPGLATLELSVRGASAPAVRFPVR